MEAPDKLGLFSYQIKYEGNQSNYLLQAVSDFIPLEVRYNIYVTYLDKDKTNITRNDYINLEIGGIVGNSHQLSYSKNGKVIDMIQFTLKGERENKTIQIPDTFGNINLILYDLNISE